MAEKRQLRAAMLELAGRRTSICPSDAARAASGDTWRDPMDPACDAAREPPRAGEVEITQRGQVLDPDAEWRGPIRIRLRGLLD